MKISGKKTNWSIWQKSPTSSWHTKIYRSPYNGHSGRNFWAWRKEMVKGKNQGIIFYPSGSRYRMWSNYNRSKSVPEW